MKGVQLTSTELYNRIDALRHKNIELQEELKKLKDSGTLGAKISGTSKKSSTIASNLTKELDSVLNELELDSTVVLNSSLPKPEEMYDEKMLETMGERDDLKLELAQKTKLLDQFKNKMENLIEKIQTFELETSGIKVENESLKDKLEKEQKRADDAVQLAERAVSAMKNKGKKR
ncbi:MAG: hypothetical protein E4G98_05035 [Promethearchaeota archaeon]|nr:MAG: hypothetical protein E4G98_05035 [Candidatus Lokiarchaeota archaeon]